MKETNIVVEPHNLWTLGKHAFHSVNKAASNVDAKIYGTKTNIVVIERPPEPPPTKGSDILSVLGIILFGIFAVVIFFLYISGHIKGRDIVGI